MRSWFIHDVRTGLTQHCEKSVVPTGLGLSFFRLPGAKAPGYLWSSLRDSSFHAFRVLFLGIIVVSTQPKRGHSASAARLSDADKNLYLACDNYIEFDLETDYRIHF